MNEPKSVALELAEKKVHLISRLEAIDITNVYGMEIEDRIKLEAARIETQKELTQVNAEIHRHISQ